MGNDTHDMTGTSPAPASAWMLMIAAGLAAALALGGAAALFSNDNKVLQFVVFALITAPPCLSLAWVAFVSGHTVARDRHGEDSVESQWITQATSGACIDMVSAAGVGLIALSVTGADISGLAALTGVVALTAIDTAARYAMLRRRAS